MNAFWVYLAALLGTARIIAIIVAFLLAILGLGGIFAGRSPASLTQARRLFLIRKGRACLTAAVCTVIFVVVVPAEDTVREMAGLPTAECE